MIIIEFRDRMKYRHRIGIYCIECFNTGEKYIGKTEDSFLNRYHSHIKKLANGKHNVKIQTRWDKLGSDNFIFYVLHEYKEGDNLNKLEKYYIQKYDSYHNGFNCSLGGNGGKLSEETKAKMRASSKHLKLTPERIKAMAESRKFAYNDESRRKMREAKINNKHPLNILNVELVIKIKQMLMQNMTINEVANALNIEYHNIRTIYRNDAWEYVYVPGYDEFIENKRSQRTGILTAEEVHEIRDLLSKGLTAPQISKITNHGVSVIYGIKNNRTYQNV